MSRGGFCQGFIPVMSYGLRAPIPRCKLSLIGEGRGKCERSVIKGYNCKQKEEKCMFKNSEVWFCSFTPFPA